MRHQSRPFALPAGVAEKLGEVFGTQSSRRCSAGMSISPPCLLSPSDPPRDPIALLAGAIGLAAIIGAIFTR